MGYWRGRWHRVVVFRGAFDSVNNGKLVGAAHFLCWRIRDKSNSIVSVQRVSSKIRWWSATWGKTFNINNRSVGASVAWDWIRTGSSPNPSKHRPVTWKYPACENSLGDESTSISAAEFTTLKFVGQKCATNFASWYAFSPYKLQIIQELTAAHIALRVRCCQHRAHAL